MRTVFIKKVSKGSRFNQVYIPKNMERTIEVGDEVEVKLIKKRASLFYSKGLKKISPFKEDLIKKVFSFLTKFNMDRMFVVGSFLLQKIDYNDIDIVLILDNEIEGFDKVIYEQLTDKYNLRFHILCIDEERFDYLLKSCPLTIAMFQNYICSKKTDLIKEEVIDKKHILFLLMMPEDLLEIDAESRVFLDSLRRLITIERFLTGKELDIDKINNDLKILIGERIYSRIKDNHSLEEKTIENLRKVIRDKLLKIKGLL